MTITTNKIVTKGLGPSRGVSGRAALVTFGFAGPFFTALVDQARVFVAKGRSATKQAADRIVVYAKLVRVNGKHVAGFAGSISVLLEALQRRSRVLVSEATARVRQTINIIVKRRK